jgi:uncharacterized protein (TIGR02145 family)
MKALLFLTSFLLVGITFSQSKKEQIEQLNYRVDSLKSIISAERDTNSQKISLFENTIKQLNQKIIGFEAQISLLNTNVSKLSSDLQTSNAERSSKQQEISNLQAQLQTKKDSLILLRVELEKLKPAPKPVVSNNTNNTSTNQVTQTGSFKSVKIGTQTWMTENLNVLTFRNGDPIPEAKTDEEWKRAGENKQTAWCYYENDPKNGSKYGKLYNWYAVNDSRGLAPASWHIPTNEEWTTLENQLGDDGKKMKSTSGWNSWEEDLTCKNCESWNAEYRKKTACHICKDTRVNGKKTHSGNGTNSSGFSGLPNEWRYGDGHYLSLFHASHYWSSTESRSSGQAWLRSLNSDSSNVIRDDLYKEFGMSVRCVKD